MEVVQAYNQPFMEATGSMEARYYDQEFSPIKFTSRRKDGVPRKAYMDSKGYEEIQKEAAELLKVTISCLTGQWVAQSSRRLMMTYYSQEEKAIAATTIFKIKV